MSEVLDRAHVASTFTGTFESKFTAHKSIAA